MDKGFGSQLSSGSRGGVLVKFRKDWSSDNLPPRNSNPSFCQTSPSFQWISPSTRPALPMYCTPSSSIKISSPCLDKTVSNEPSHQDRSSPVTVPIISPLSFQS